MNSSNDASAKGGLVRGLGLWDAVGLVVGTVIGTGIFLKTTVMAQEAGSPGWVLWAWLAAGALSLAGALAYAELGCLFPHAGGEYVYLREAYGELPAFLCGWTRFWIGSPGSIAAYAVAVTMFADSDFFHPDALPGGRATFAVGLILVFSVLNCLAVTVSGRVATALTAFKAILIAALAFGLFGFSSTASVEHWSTAQAGAHFPGWTAFGAAVLAALWAFDGWNGMPMMAGEIRDARRNVPMGLVFGVLAVGGLYAAVNVAYFYALPFGEILGSNSSAHPDAPTVAAKAASTFLGSSGVAWLTFAFIVSALGAMNATILAGARVPYAMAADRLAPAWMGNLSARTRVPVWAMAAQAVVASALAISGTFDQLTDYVVFASWIFYLAVTGAVFVFRKRMPDAPRAYRAWGYPWFPSLFLFVAGALLVSTVIQNPKGTGIGLAFIAAGWPAFLWFRRRTP